MHYAMVKGPGGVSFVGSHPFLGGSTVVGISIAQEGCG